MSNIFNRQTTALKLPDSVEINDNTNSLSTSSSAAPSFVAGGSAIIEKDLKVDDIAYLNECRINTLPTSTIDAKQAFTNYVSLVGQKINNKDTLIVQGDVKATGEIQATTISGLINASSIQSTGNVQAGSFNGDSASISNNIGAGSITCTGNIGTGSITCTGNIGTGSITCTGNIGTGSIICTGNIGTGSITCTGNVDAGSMNINGVINCQDLKINNASISTTYAPATGSTNYAPKVYDASKVSGYQPAGEYAPKVYDASKVSGYQPAGEYAPATGSTNYLASTTKLQDLIPNDTSINLTNGKQVFAFSDNFLQFSNRIFGSSATNSIIFEVNPNLNFPKNTIIKFNRQLNTINPNTEYYVFSYNVATYTMQLSDSFNGPLKLITSTWTNGLSTNMTYKLLGTGIGFRSLLAADIPTLDYVSSTTSRTKNQVLAAPSDSDGVPTFRALVSGDIPTLDYVSSTTSRTKNQVLAAPSDSDGVPIFRALVSEDIPDLSSKYTVLPSTRNSNTVCAFPADATSTTPAEFRHVTGNDFGILLPSTGARYLGVSALGGSPSFIGIDATESVTNVLAGAAIVSFGTVPNFPKMQKNYVFASGPTADDERPGFRSIVPEDFTFKAANVILAGPASGAQASPLFRNLVPADFGTTDRANLILGGNASNGPTFRNVTHNDFSDQNANVILAGPTSGTTKPTFRKLVAADIPPIRQLIAQDPSVLLYNDYPDETRNKVYAMSPEVTRTMSIKGSSQFHSIVFETNPNVFFIKNTQIVFVENYANLMPYTAYYVYDYDSLTFSMRLSATIDGPVLLISTSFGFTPVIIKYTLPICFRSLTADDIPPLSYAPPFNMQPPNTVLAGPPNNLNGNDYPNYRLLIAADIPDLSSLYAPKSNSPNYAPAFMTQVANTFFAGPDGSVGLPTFRAIVAADIPALEYAPVSGSTNYVSTTTSQLQNQIFAAPSDGNGPPLFRSLVYADLPINGNLALTADTNHTIDASLCMFVNWQSGASSSSRTFTVVNLTPGREVKFFLRSTNPAAKTMNFIASSTTTGFANVQMSKGGAGGIPAYNIQLAANGGCATVIMFNAGGAINGCII